MILPNECIYVCERGTVRLWSCISEYINMRLSALVFVMFTAHCKNKTGRVFVHQPSSLQCMSRQRRAGKEMSECGQVSRLHHRQSEREPLTAAGVFGLRLNAVLWRFRWQHKPKAAECQCWFFFFVKRVNGHNGCWRAGVSTQTAISSQALTGRKQQLFNTVHAQIMRQSRTVHRISHSTALWRWAEEIFNPPFFWPLWECITCSKCIHQLGRHSGE